MLVPWKNRLLYHFWNNQFWNWLLQTIDIYWDGFGWSLQVIFEAKNFLWHKILIFWYTLNIQKNLSYQKINLKHTLSIDPSDYIFVRSADWYLLTRYIDWMRIIRCHCFQIDQVRPMDPGKLIFWHLGFEIRQCHETD